MSLRTRLTLVAATAVAVSTVLVTLVVFYAERRELQLLVDGDLNLQAAAVAEQLAASGEVEPSAAQGPFGGTLAQAQVVSAGGEVVSLTGDAPGLPVDDRARAVARGEADRFYTDTRGDTGRMRMLVVPLRDGALQVSRSLADLDQHIVHVAWLLVGVTVAGLGVAVILGRLVAGAALGPVAKLTAGAERVSATQDLSSRLEVSGGDELGRLATSLNTMLEALSRSQHSQRRLVADASHELRTPLASMRTNIEVLEAATQLPRAERARIVTDVRSEIEGLIATVDDLLNLARDGASVDEHTEIDLAALTERSVAWARRRSPDVSFSTKLMPVVVHGDAAAVQRALSNLLDNAAKWTAPNTTVEVTLDHDGLAVRDRGPGIAADDLPRVFERFYRSAAARSRPGAGLGLAIVRQVADRHHWQVGAENAAGGGSRFTVRFRPDSSPVLTTRSAPSQSSGTDSPPRRRERTVTEGRRTGARHLLQPVRLVLAAVAAVPLLVGIGLSVVGADSNPPLRTMTGTLAACEPQYCIGETIVDFGPSWYLADATARHDFDDDGGVTSLGEEITGLVGTRVTLETDDGPLDADVFTVNGLPLRSATGELPAPRRPSPAHLPAGADTSRQVKLTGAVQRCGDDYCIGDTVTDFGPLWFRERARSPIDLDDDGQRSLLSEELSGLVGRRVRISGLADAGKVAVLKVDGDQYRHERDPPPWAGGPLRPLPGGRADERG